MKLFNFLRTKESLVERCFIIDSKIDSLVNEINNLAVERDEIKKSHDLRIGILNNKMTICKGEDDKETYLSLRKKFEDRLHKSQVYYDKVIIDKTKDVYTLKSELSKLLEDREINDIYKSKLEKQRIGDSYELIVDAFKSGKLGREKFKEIRKKTEKKLDNRVSYSDMILYSGDGCVLLLKRNNEDEMFSGKWCLPGGHVDPGEPHKEAAIRELAEETLIELPEGAFVNLVGKLDKKDVYIEYYTAYCEDRPNVVLNSREHETYEWVKPQDLYLYDMIGDSLDILDKILGYNIDHVTEIKKGEQYQVGEISKKTGLKKVAPGKWVDPKTGKQVKGEEQKESKDKKPDEKGVEKEKSIEDHARSASNKALEEASKGSDEELRVKAKEELLRREQEENPENKEAEDKGGESEEEIQLFLDIISMDVENKKYDKYKKLLKEKHNVDWEEYIKDDEYIKGVDLKDIKKKGDFKNFDKYIDYAKKVFELRGLGKNQPKQLDKSITIKQSKELLKPLGVEVKHKEYSGEGNYAQVEHDSNVIEMPEKMDINTLIHELGHVYHKIYKGTKSNVADNITNASSSYQINKTDEVFAENFMNFFIAPDWLKENLVDVYSDLDKNIDDKWKKTVKGLFESKEDKAELAEINKIELPIKFDDDPEKGVSFRKGEAKIEVNSEDPEKVTNAKLEVNLNIPIVMDREGGDSHTMNGYSAKATGAYNKDKKEFEIRLVWMDPELKRKGVGRLLVKKLMSQVKEGYKVTTSGVYSEEGRAFTSKLSEEGVLPKKEVEKSIADTISQKVDNYVEKVVEMGGSRKDKLKGGLADSKTVKQIATKHGVTVGEIVEQLRTGVEVEFEHTKDIKVSTEIAMDHLMESPVYYTKLKEMEESFEKALDVLILAHNQGKVTTDQFEKAIAGKKDISKLTKIKKLVKKDGKIFLQTYYVKSGDIDEYEDKVQWLEVEAMDDIGNMLSQGDKIMFKYKGGQGEGWVNGFSYEKKTGLFYIGIDTGEGGGTVWKLLNKNSGLKLHKKVETLDGEIDSNGYRVIKNLGGSTGAKLVEKDGVKYVKKTGNSPEHLANEVRSLKYFKQMGVPVPDAVKYIKGEAVYIEYIDGKTLQELKSSKGLTEDELWSKYKQIIDHFSAHALMANWDMVGLSEDNIMFDKTTGVVSFVDVGGSMGFRAQGGKKESWEDWKDGDKVADFKTMFENDDIYQKIHSYYFWKVASPLDKGLSDFEFKQKVKEWFTGEVYSQLKTLKQINPECLQGNTEFSKKLSQRFNKVYETYVGSGVSVGEVTPKEEEVKKVVIPEAQIHDELKDAWDTVGVKKENYQRILNLYNNEIDVANKYGRHDIAELYKHIANNFAMTEAEQALADEYANKHDFGFKVSGKNKVDFKEHNGLQDRHIWAINQHTSTPNDIFNSVVLGNADSYNVSFLHNKNLVGFNEEKIIRAKKYILEGADDSDYGTRKSKMKFLEAASLIEAFSIMEEKRSILVSDLDHVSTSEKPPIEKKLKEMDYRQDITVYRGFNMQSQSEKVFKDDNIIISNNALSHGVNVAKAFYSDSKINSYSVAGVYIDPISKHSGEKEVLTKPYLMSQIIRVAQKINSSGYKVTGFNVRAERPGLFPLPSDKFTKEN